MLRPEMTEPLIPDLLANYYSIFAILFVGLVAEEYYISRITMFANSGALLLHAKQFPEVGLFVAVYVLIGLVVGLIGFGSYTLSSSLPDGFYQLAYFSYSSAQVALMMMLTFLFSPNLLWLAVGLALGVLANSKLLTMAPGKMAPVESFEYPAQLADALFGKDWRY